MTHRKSILAVLAHPDDETFGLGGTLATYARKAYDTYYLCATRGEAGSADEKYRQGYNSTADMRTAELMRAAKQLGLSGVYFLGYRDSGMPGMPENQHPDAQINHSVDEVAGRIVKYIRELKPDVVITHDPIGGYKHPDHIHVHKATTLAFERANDPTFHPEAGAPYQPQALYYQVISKRLLRLGIRLMRLLRRDPTRFGRNKDINLVDLVQDEFPIHVRLNVRPVRSQKILASAEHASQGGRDMQRGWMSVLRRLLGDYEEFMRVYPPVTETRPRLAKDLFDF